MGKRVNYLYDVLLPPTFQPHYSSQQLFVHKISNVQVVCMVTGLNYFDASKSLMRAIGRCGQWPKGPWKWRPWEGATTFLALKWSCLTANGHFWAKKVSSFMSGALWICLHQNNYVLRHDKKTSTLIVLKNHQRFRKNRHPLLIIEFYIISLILWDCPFKMFRIKICFPGASFELQNQIKY
jgi:hypothetical protein